MDCTALSVGQSSSPFTVLEDGSKCSATAHAANKAARWHGGYVYLSVILELSVSTDPDLIQCFSVPTY